MFGHSYESTRGLQFLVNVYDTSFNLIATHSVGNTQYLVSPESYDYPAFRKYEHKSSTHPIEIDVLDNNSVYVSLEIKNNSMGGDYAYVSAISLVNIEDYFEIIDNIITSSYVSSEINQAFGDDDAIDNIKSGKKPNGDSITADDIVNGDSKFLPFVDSALEVSNLISGRLLNGNYNPSFLGSGTIHVIYEVTTDAGGNDISIRHDDIVNLIDAEISIASGYKIVATNIEIEKESSSDVYEIVDKFKAVTKEYDSTTYDKVVLEKIDITDCVASTKYRINISALFKKVSTV
jgi:hypothetical protein